MSPDERSSSGRFTRDVQVLLDDRLCLVLPDEVLDIATKQAHDAGITPEEAAIHICHQQAWRASRAWVKEESQASDLAEFVIAARLEESARLAVQTGMRLIDLLPDLPDYLWQPCFSDDLRTMIEALGICKTSGPAVPSRLSSKGTTSVGPSADRSWGATS